MLPIVRSTDAAKDVASIWDYIANDNFDAADRVVDQFVEALNLISQWPHSGTERADLATGIRSYPVGKYIIFYRVLPTAIEVVRILHSARNLRRIFGRRRGS
jgi:toxin ParE1/3/4